MTSDTINDPSPVRKLASWWAPSGWYQEPDADPYRNAMAQIDDGDSWEENLRGHAYTDILSSSEESVSYYRAIVWSHPTNFMVSLETMDGEAAYFFVAAEHKAAFLVEKWPGIVQATQMQIGETSHPLLKAIAAFIRHEHGRNVISEDGQRNREDFQRADEERRRAQQRTAPAPKPAVDTPAGPQ